MRSMVPTDFDVARHNMIEQQVRPWAVLDLAVLDVLRAIPRERFVPPEYLGLAFADTEVPLALGQQMLAPRVVGRLLQALRIGAEDRVLEVGTGSGFVTACLARMGRKVVSLEVHEELAAVAAGNLSELDVGNAEVQMGDAFEQDFSGDQFDAIAVTGSCPLYPETWQNWLAPGGRMFVVVGTGPSMEATLVQRVGEQQWHREDLFETALPALVNAPRRPVFAF